LIKKIYGKDTTFIELFDREKVNKREADPKVHTIAWTRAWLAGMLDIPFFEGLSADGEMRRRGDGETGMYCIS
jgi:hypothetical protein